MPINVISAGISTTVQDLGRPGYYHLGIPMGGAMDRMALRAGNLLVGNEEGAACLECAFFGPELEFTEDAVIAITGAELPPKIDGAPQPTWTALDVRAGQVLSFDYLQAGARAYIAVAGGIDVPMALGSRSTYAIGALGGVKGRAVQPGDELPIGTGAKAGTGKSLPPELRRLPAARAELRILPGLYNHRLTEASLTQFFKEDWRVANEADRMGYRFQGGTPLEFVAQDQPFGAGSDPSNITDACYPYGSVQVPSGAEPIILHRDAVSGGGYFMLGTVISADMDLIGQLQPNMHVRFVPVDMATALQARHDRRQQLDRIRKALA
ncbi:biotin-dependent carboxyltransferase family protein [Thioclava sp. GXIMD4216]|uniref:5-oxoprolinase subunit C family protein n=1 Tax=Thioclava sp. GXIMD4216 TaxID=3131929 RepID=UPI0030D219EA